MLVQEFDYDAPEELIAQTPGPRGESRLLVLHRETGRIEHRMFADLIEYLRPEDTLVLNDTRVTARRLFARRENGRISELLILAPIGGAAFSALVRPGRPARIGTRLEIESPDGGTITATVMGETPDGGRVLDVGCAGVRDSIFDWGEIPLPPYIHVPLPRSHEERYQTVYAARGGSAAAPTAGLHLTSQSLDAAIAKGVAVARVTLNVGVGTFRPVREARIEDHVMHAERIEVDEEACRIVNATRGRVIAVGTTSVRALETSAEGAEAGERIAPYAGDTRLFIAPGFRFRVTNSIVTNFHLPRSTLLMLVCAFAGRDHAMNAYNEAVRERYRLFSFGDAMLAT